MPEEHHYKDLVVGIVIVGVVDHARSASFISNIFLSSSFGIVRQDHEVKDETKAKIDNCVKVVFRELIVPFFGAARVVLVMVNKVGRQSFLGEVLINELKLR